MFTGEWGECKWAAYLRWCTHLATIFISPVDGSNNDPSMDADLQAGSNVVSGIDGEINCDCSDMK